MNIIEITYLEPQFSESGKRKLEEINKAQEELEKIIEEEGDMPEGYDPKYRELYDELNLNPLDEDEPYYEVEFTKEDYEFKELEGGILKDDISYFFKTNDENSTTVETKSGKTIKIKESVNFLCKKLAR